MFENAPKLGEIPAILCSSMPVAQIPEWFPENPRRRYLVKPPDLQLLKEAALQLLPLKPR